MAMELIDSGAGPILIILGGRPASGKSTIADALARRSGATWIRIDSIEQALRDSGMGADDRGDAGYRVGYAIAEDNLRLGRTVIAESVNPWKLTREAWRNVAVRAGVPSVDVEIVCSDPVHHRERAETRSVAVPGLKIPTWQEIVDRDYHAWDTEHIVIDTSDITVEASVDLLALALNRARAS